MLFRSRVVRFCGCATVALLFGMSGVALAQTPPSLADVAAKEQQRRKSLKRGATGKVYKNEDLGPNAEAAPPPPAPAATPEGQTAGPGGPEGAAAPPPAESQQPEDPTKTEEYWRQRMQGARSELQRNELFLDALQSRVNALTTDFVNRDDPAQRAVIANDRQRALAEMERVKRSIEELTQQIVDIEEEARRAGIPPGWIR